MTEQMAALGSKPIAQLVETAERHLREEMGEHALLGLVVGVQTEFHQYEQRGIEGKREEQSAPSTGVGYELYERVA